MSITNFQVIGTGRTGQDKTKEGIVTDLQKYKLSKAQAGVQKVLDVLSNFIIQIFNDVLGVDSDKWSYRFEQNDLYIMLFVCNGETGQIVGKNYSLLWFMELCSTKKIEFKLNVTIRQMILRAQSERMPGLEVVWL